MSCDHLTSRQRAMSLAAVIAASFGVGVSFGVGFPLTALTFELWGEPEWMIGLAGATPAIAVLLALPQLPRLVARLGPVAAIAAGCVLGGLGFIALYLFQTAPLWLAIRLAMSAGLALPWLAGETWINTVATERTRGRVIALYAIAFFSGFSVGPILLDALGLRGPGAFLLGAAGTALAGVPILLARRLAPRFVHDTHTGVLDALRLAPVAMLGAFIGGFAEISNLSLIPNVALAAGQDRTTALAVLSALSIGGVALQFPIGWLTDKAPRIHVIVALAAAFIVLSLLLPIALQNATAALAVAFLLGGVVLGFYTVGLAIVGQTVSAERLAAANATFLVMYQAGAIVGPFASGLAMSVDPVLGFVATMVGLMAISTLALRALTARHRG